MNIEWTASADMLPEGAHFGIAFAPGAASGATANDKGVGGDSAGVGSGYDITVGSTGLMDGLNVFAGMSTIEQPSGASAGSSTDGDRTQYVAGATFAVGAVTMGYQFSRDNTQSNQAAATSHYDNDAFGISFAVNDDLSISYGQHTSDRVRTDASSVELEAQSLQLSYTMGGMSIKFAESSVDNASYTSGTSADWDGRTIALTLAF
jgi:outer membrane protein OmpU